jgi:hypothetical protein
MTHTGASEGAGAITMNITSAAHTRAPIAIGISKRRRSNAPSLQSSRLRTARYRMIVMP